MPYQIIFTPNEKSDAHAIKGAPGDSLFLACQRFVEALEHEGELQAIHDELLFGDKNFIFVPQEGAERIGSFFKTLDLVMSTSTPGEVPSEQTHQRDFVIGWLHEYSDWDKFPLKIFMSKGMFLIKRTSAYD